MSHPTWNTRNEPATHQPDDRTGFSVDTSPTSNATKSLWGRSEAGVGTGGPTGLASPPGGASDCMVAMGSAEISLVNSLNDADDNPKIVAESDVDTGFLTFVLDTREAQVAVDDNGCHVAEGESLLEALGFAVRDSNRDVAAADDGEDEMPSVTRNTRTDIPGATADGTQSEKGGNVTVDDVCSICTPEDLKILEEYTVVSSSACPENARDGLLDEHVALRCEEHIHVHHSVADCDVTEERFDTPKEFSSSVDPLPASDTERNIKDFSAPGEPSPVSDTKRNIRHFSTSGEPSPASDNEQDIRDFSTSGEPLSASDTEPDIRHFIASGEPLSASDTEPDMRHFSESSEPLSASDTEPDMRHFSESSEPSPASDNEPDMRHFSRSSEPSPATGYESTLRHVDASAETEDSDDHDGFEECDVTLFTKLDSALIKGSFTSGGFEAVVFDLPDSIPSDDEDFFDALDHQVEKEFEVALPHNKDKLHRRTDSDFSMESYVNDMSSESESEGSVNEARVYTTKANSPKKLVRQGSGKKEHKRTGSQEKIRVSKSTADNVDSSFPNAPLRRRRKWITEKPNISLNLWSVMKNCIGKELSKIPMPVNFNEPLSMLQRLTEELEYSEILDNASLCDDSCEQLAHVAAFTVSAYATTLFRSGKPFNPLLGETFEFDRMDDLGWRSLAEQVSHHPPALATHTEGRQWTLWQEFTMTTKFRGRYLQIIPMGIAHLVFKKSGNHYTWRKVSTTVHNIIVGKLWVDNQGEMDITNHTTGDKCHLKYSAYSYFSRESPRKVTGVITDHKENVRWVLTGHWCTKMEGAPIIHVDESNKGKPVFETGPHKLLWKVRPPPNGAERIYYFSQLAIEMNEPEEGVAPTDSRNRPDQRLMEEGKWDEANRVKIMLEEKQRLTRKHRESEVEKAKEEGIDMKYQAAWFSKEMDPITNQPMHVYNGKYWECKTRQDWSRCPDIYL